MDIIQDIHKSHFVSLKDKANCFELKILTDCRKIFCDYGGTQLWAKNVISSRDQYFKGRLIIH